MFGRDIELLGFLDQSSLTDLLRKIMEGRLLFSYVASAKTKKELEELRIHADQADAFVGKVTDFTETLVSLDGLHDKADHHLKKYNALPIEERMNQKETMAATLLKTVKPNSKLYQQFERMAQLDLGLIYVANVVACLYVLDIFSLRDIPDRMQALSLLYPEHSAKNPSDPSILNALTKARKLYNALYWCVISEDKQLYFSVLIKNLIDGHLHLTAQLLQSITLLQDLASTVFERQWNPSTSLFSSHKFPVIVKLRAELTELPSALSGFSNPEDRKKLEAMANTFYAVYNILEHETSKKALFPDKKELALCKTWFEKIKVVEESEADALQSVKQARSVALRK